MSGFFMIRTDVARAIIPELSAIGFKILLDLVVASKRKLKFVELPYVFRSRTRGESKLDYVVAMEFLIALYNPVLGKAVPVRFLMFSLIGALGLGVHMAILSILYLALGIGFVAAQIAATAGAMTSNFLVNNALTYRDKRLRGSRAILLGWLSFCAVCGLGAVANVGIAAFLHEARGGEWTTAALAGVVVSAVWNYALSSKFVWGRY
jgi:dolichol-phosphate mannosyltransferase